MGELYYFNGTEFIRLNDIEDCPEEEVPPKYVRKLRWMMAMNHLRAAFELIFGRCE